MIDTHVHVGGGKYAPFSAWLAAEDLHGIDGAVLVQNLGNDQNDELLTARAVDPERYAVIAIPKDMPAADELLSAGVAGFRLGADGLHARPGDYRVLDRLAEGGGVASVFAPFEEIASEAFRDLVDRYPAVTFRLEHLGGYRYSVEDPAAEGFQPVADLAKRHNTVIMWSGFFVTSGQEPPYRDAWPTLERSLAAFGPERVVWSGDWNRAGGSAKTYEQDMAAIRAFPFLDEDATGKIVDANPRRIFGLGARA